jgi:hypothetical protein
MFESLQEHVRRDVLKRIKEGAAQGIADEMAWAQHSLATIRDAILAHKQAKHLNCDALDVVLWSHVSE